MSKYLCMSKFKILTWHTNNMGEAGTRNTPENQKEFLKTWNWHGTAVHENSPQQC